MDETKPIPRHNWKAILGLTLACLVCSTSAVLPFWDLMVTRAGSVGNLIWPREPPLVTIGAGVDLLGTLWTFDFVGNLLSGEATMDTPLLSWAPPLSEAQHPMVVLLVVPYTSILRNKPRCWLSGKSRLVLLELLRCCLRDASDLMC